MSCARIEMGGTVEKFGGLITRIGWSGGGDRPGLCVEAFGHQWGQRSTQPAPSLTPPCAKESGYQFSLQDHGQGMSSVPGGCRETTSSLGSAAPRPKGRRVLMCSLLPGR